MRTIVIPNSWPGRLLVQGALVVEPGAGTDLFQYVSQMRECQASSERTRSLQMG
jgi:hypothetical protein